MTFLDGKVVIITGAGRGLGAAYAMAAAEAGAAVMVNDVDTDAAARTVRSIATRGGQAIADAADIATWSGVGSLVDHCVDAFGRIDGLVNNAGLYRLTASRVVRTSHPFSLCPQSTSRARCMRRCALRHMLAHRTGAIVNVTRPAATRRRVNFMAG
jgi:NAD(P)-dependent dehydrogenase (short-subunit alcohol dehydrogenase family)